MFFHCKRLHSGFVLPTSGLDPETLRVDPDSVGFDIYAPEDGSLDALCSRIVKLGFAASFTPGYMGLLLDRSGMGAKGITRLGGVIDPSYRKEWGAILYNTTHKTFNWKAGQRIIQVVFVKVEKPTPIEVSELEETARVGGFGSTGQ